MNIKRIHGLITGLLILVMMSCNNDIEVTTSDNFEQVELPDSSIVYLNKNSKLTYNKDFNPRTVTLEGEAFFSVNDGETPFKVLSKEDEEVTVLGTEFNLIITSKNVFLEVEIGKVNIRIGDRSNDIGRGRRLDYGRHDNGLHLGHAKREYRSWISIMSKDFKKSGRVMKRSFKHRSKAVNKGTFKSNKALKPKGGGLKLPKANKPMNNKSGGKPAAKNDKGGGSKNDKGKKGKN